MSDSAPDPAVPGSFPGDPAIAVARGLLQRARRIVVLTGASISTDSGIPDFRGPQGVWTRDPSAERLATLQAYVEDPDVRARAWRSRVESPTWAAQPNAGHRALIALEAGDRLALLVTQNIDGLHQEAGSDPARIVEIHGTMRDIVCLRCGDRGPAEPTLDRVRGGQVDPHCTKIDSHGALCDGILKSATISFGQNLVVEDLERAEQAARSCDALLAVGSTLSVFPAAGLVPVAARAGAAIVIINGEPTEMDSLADALLHGPISKVLPAIAEPAS